MYTRFDVNEMNFLQNDSSTKRKKKCSRVFYSYTDTVNYFNRRSLSSTIRTIIPGNRECSRQIGVLQFIVANSATPKRALQPARKYAVRVGWCRLYRTSTNSKLAEETLFNAYEFAISTTQCTMSIGERDKNFESVPTW